MEHYKNLSLENIVFYDDEGNKYIEEWTDILTHSGLYEISTLGRVRNRKAILKWRLKKDYDTCRLSKKNKYSDLSKHRLVGIYFIPNPENKPEVNHKNGIKWDNRICNLEWNTTSENGRHAYAGGFSKPRRGEKSNFAKINEEAVREIRAINPLDIEAKKNLQLKYNIKRPNINAIIARRIWKHVI